MPRRERPCPRRCCGLVSIRVDGGVPFPGHVHCGEWAAARRSAVASALCARAPARRFVRRGGAVPKRTALGDRPPHRHDVGDEPDISRELHRPRCCPYPLWLGPSCFRSRAPPPCGIPQGSSHPGECVHRGAQSHARPGRAGDCPTRARRGGGPNRLLDRPCGGRERLHLGGA